MARYFCFSPDNVVIAFSQGFKTRELKPFQINDVDSQKTQWFSKTEIRKFMKYTDVSSLNIRKNSSRRGWGMENWIRETIPCTASSLDRKKVGALTFQSLSQGLELMNTKVSPPSPFRDFPDGRYLQEKYERWSKYLTS